MGKKKIILILSIPFIGILIALGIFFLTADNSPSTSRIQTAVSPDTSSFENNFYDYLAQSLQEIFLSSNGGNSEEIGKKVVDLTEEGIAMIDEFIEAQKQEDITLNEADHNRLNQLRFYVYSSIAIDEKKTRETLDLLPNNSSKLALLYSYIETFTKEDTRHISQTAFQNYLVEQSPWAEAIEASYLDKIITLQFKADPIGKSLPNFLAKYKDMKGRDLDLQGFRGQYVLLDFWATWCLPCIAEFPYLQEAYQNFSKKGFEIISVSLDNNREAFEKFIAERNIPWIQYYDGKGFRGELVRDYGVSGIPTLYLIDIKGKIISANMRGEELIRILNSHLGT